MTTPDRTFHFECPQAQELVWLPLAVRFKLDQCQLRLRLIEWQQMPFDQRTSLLACPPGEAFRQLLVSLVPTAVPTDRSTTPIDLHRPGWPTELDLQRFLAGEAWAARWENASPFERYLVAKIMHSVRPEERAKALASVVFDGAGCQSASAPAPTPARTESRSPVPTGVATGPAYEPAAARLPLPKAVERSIHVDP
jgi:hypothetical protein